MASRQSVKQGSTPTSKVKTRRKKVPKQSSSAGQRSDDDYYFDDAEAKYVIDWVETFTTHPQGKLMGQPLICAPWARHMYQEAFGWKRKKDGKRRYTIVYVELPRGNAKSTYGSSTALYLLLGDQENRPEIYCAAGSKDQAGKVFDPIKVMVRQNQELSENLRVYGNSVYDDESMGSIKVVSADGKMQHGHNASGVIFDELHIQPNGDLYEAFTTGIMKREQPIIFIFTTAGVLGTFAEEIHNYAVKVRDGIVRDDRFLPIIYGAPEDADPFDEKTWEIANPGWSYLNQDEFRAMAAQAKESAIFLNSFKRYNLNIWTGSETVWIPDELFLRGHDKGFDIEEMDGRDVYLGVDLSSNVDTSSVVYIFPPIAPGERWKVKTDVFIPKESLKKRIERETVQYQNWAKDGHIYLTYGETQDYVFIRQTIEENGKRWNIRNIAYDRKFATESVQMLKAAGLPTMAYLQNYDYMTVAMQKVEAMFKNSQFEHNNNPVLRWHFQCCSAVERGPFMMPGRKNMSKQRIDAVVALIIAVGGYNIMLGTVEEKKKESLLTKGGIPTVKINLRRR